MTRRDLGFTDERIERWRREYGRGLVTEYSVAADLLTHSLAVRVGEPVPEDFDNWEEHRRECADQVDIEVGELVAVHRVEVKGRGFAFTSPDDYPYDTAFVGNVERWKRRTVSVCSVVLRSEPTGACVVVPAGSRPHWVVEEKYDRVRGRMEASYAVPRDFLLPGYLLAPHLSFEWCPWVLG